MDDLDTRRDLTVLLERLLERGLIADEKDAHALACGLDGSCNGHQRCLVAAHRIDGDDDVGHRAQAPVSPTARPL